MNQLIQVSDIDNNLFKLFKDQFDVTLKTLTLSQPLNYPFIYYQTIELKNFVISSTQRLISVYQGNEKIVDIIFDKSNLISSVTLFKPTLIVLSISLLYALFQSVSQYGFEKLNIYVKDKSLSLIINVKDNSKDILNKIISFMNELQDEINQQIINISLLLIVLYILYKSIN